MTRIFKHLIRIIKHKYWVARYCFQLGLYWQGIVHDWSKFSYTEFSRSIKYWDDTISPLANEKNIHGYSETFLHHRGRNPHHYEYWVHSLDEGGVPAKMPRKYALELVCDYLAAGRTYNKDFTYGSEYNWWIKFLSSPRAIHPETKDFVTKCFRHLSAGGQYYGAYYMLGKIFGWNTTSKDYRYPSTKVGLLYGDSITLERQKQIYLRLENAHMAACNLVLGVGSYSYQYASRDSLGFAIKATACVVNGELKEIFKHPKTDDGTKNSLKGLIAVYKGLDGKYTATDQVSIEEEKEGCLETVFEDGILKKEYSLEEIRQRIDHGL